ncbi:MAG: MFS transporter [Bacteroidales bacterium]|nr:MFS transporter [Bacteroidales bacterium]
MNNIDKIKKSRNPWKWIPTLYFAEGLPNVAVAAISIVMFKRLGLSNEATTFFASLITLPWVIKPIWSPFVDLIRTKRWWVILMQILMTFSFLGVALSIETHWFVTLSLIFFAILAFFSATHDIAADGYYMLELNSHKQSLFVGIRSTFYRLSTIAGKGLLVMLAGLLETITRNVHRSWSITFLVLAIIFGLLTIYHYFFMPKAEKDVPSNEHSAHELMQDFVKTFTTFFKKPGALPAICFMFFYRFPEALLSSVGTLFLLDPPSQGGLGMSTQEFGLATGTVGIIGLTLGGILGGFLAAKWGLKKSLWPMVLLITVPDVLYVLLSIFQIQNFAVINAFIFIEQFGYGFGFTAYMLYLIYYAQGESQTSHYAICTGFMALSLLVPGLFAGALQEMVGYTTYFIIVIASCAITFAVSAWIKIDPEFGKK